jgi:hypothetical protein
LVLAATVTQGVPNVTELIELGINGLTRLYRATNYLLGAESGYPKNLIPADVTHRRGRTLVDQLTAQDLIDDARRLAGENVPPGYRGVSLGAVRCPTEILNHGVFIQGTTGSGKSSLLDGLKLSLIPLIQSGCGPKTRIIDFDDKGSALGKWYTMLPPSVPVWYFQPLSLSSIRWDLYKDFVVDSDFAQLASMIIPEESGGSENSFWYDSARETLRALIDVLHRFGGPWTLRHLVTAAAERKVLFEILHLCPETRSIARRFLGDSKEGRAVHSTLTSCLGKYSVVAACQEHTDHGFSVSEFQDSEGILVLGYDPAATAAIMGLHQLIVRRLSETALRRQDMDDRTLFIFDEFRLWSSGTKSPSDTLVTTAFRGRSSGSGLIIGTQDVNGPDHIYRRELARELLGNLLTKVFLHSESVESARFASESIGGHEVILSTWNESWSEGRCTRSHNRSIIRRDLATPDEIMAIPKADWHRDRIEGYCITPVTPPFYFTTSFRGVAAAVRPPIDFIANPPRPGSQQRLKPFRLKDAKALNFPPRPALLKLLR